MSEYVSGDFRDWRKRSVLEILPQEQVLRWGAKRANRRTDRHTGIQKIMKMFYPMNFQHCQQPAPQTNQMHLKRSTRLIDASGATGLMNGGKNWFICIGNALHLKFFDEVLNSFSFSNPYLFKSDIWTYGRTVCLTYKMTDLVTEWFTLSPTGAVTVVWSQTMLQ